MVETFNKWSLAGTGEIESSAHQGSYGKVAQPLSHSCSRSGSHSLPLALARPPSLPSSLILAMSEQS